MRNAFDRIEEVFLVGSLAFNVVLIFIQVVMRYVFQNSLSWSEELARYIFLWQTWVGASYAVRMRRHFRVEMIVDLMKGRLRKWYEFVVLLVWCAFALFIAWQGSVLTTFLIKRWQVSAAMQIPIAWAYASVPAGCAMMAIRLVMEMKDLLRDLRSGAAC
ncbi:TRAP transporter small permease [Aminivibrio sp.]|uniref:TRAP transporter small permease n=1 Tax=Aminivibrio sp. TaxID=1872489 RepID=UPI001A4FCCEF|nr:TRAP transporter small permease [Aminivibrio sp.]MBL3539201.1 TRAP transporter small permease [Aminivibrio sp.]